ncbi:unnamed protein product [Notodromas monacha]|uniref:Membrane-associated guanylate kinase, WW and PDZ domain-containing protein 2 n=1 Tax=Notodromas monacha TaxID=399045 RepID=A0A7R9BXS1_9CRUS|nr:unnamed protein product [Notodromas monacha]CAG0922366.1 unnamed protein product [Notodromas monacha]
MADLPESDLSSPPGPNGNRGDGMEAPPANAEAPYFDAASASYRQFMNRPLTPELGPLGDNWEKAFTEKGEPYFIDKTTRTSSWLDPRLSQIQKQNLEDCADDELPFGWERIDDPHYGAYYIDHVNRKTQYENPVLQAKRLKQEREQMMGPDQLNEDYRGTNQPPYYCNTDPNEINGNVPHQLIHQSEPRMPQGRLFFTRDPNQLMGNIIHSSLLKGPRGLGFTIVGGDDHEEEFLQIKSVVHYGPAWEDGRLETGDVLVYVNNTCVLGFTHHDMVSMFQAIGVGERVNLTVCRGYPLPFDPNDPNTEIVTTVAVSSLDGPHNMRSSGYDRRQDGPDGVESTNHSDDSMSRSAKSMPDLTNDAKDRRPDGSHMRPGSADLLVRSGESASEVQVGPTAEHFTVLIIKGAHGFGFTIADTPYGQLKVKKIHDRVRCKNLLEGDILCEINGIDVRGMSRSDVVQVLSECPMEEEARILIFRSVYRFRRGDGDSGANSDSGIGRSTKPAGFGLFRSKTPTADLYRTEPREIIPHRPKTPLLDIRLQNKSGNLNSPNKQFPGAFSYSSGFVPKSSEPETTRSGNVAFLAQQFSAAHISSRNVQPGASVTKEAISDNTHSYGGSACYGFDEEKPDDSNHGRNQLDYPANDPYTRDFFQNQQEFYPQHGPQSPPGAEMYQQQYLGQYFYSSAETGEYGMDGPYGHHDVSGSGYNSVNRDYPNHDYAYRNGYSPRAQYVSPQVRKESTSFEHEQPSPSPLVRIPKDLMHGRQVTFGNRARGAIDYVDTVITLPRMDEGFGFRILGGAEESSQVSIGQVLPGGAAAADGRLRHGDELVAIDGHSVINASHHHVINLMSAAAVNGRVSLTIRRPASNPNTHFSPEHAGRVDIYPYDVTVTRRENEGFGFVIISSLAKAGSTIGRIIEGSPAERCGKLHIGDRILAVNEQSILHLPHGDIVSMIKDSGYSVTLRIGPPQADDNSSTASTSHRGESEGIDEEYYSVELARGERGFGFSIRGGKEFMNMPLFVLRMAENGPAALDGRLNVGDQIIEINGMNTKDMAHADAIELIKAGPTVRLVVKRGVGVLPAALETAGSLAGSGIIGADSDEPPSPGPGTAHFGMAYRPQKVSPQHTYFYPPHMNGPNVAMSDYGPVNGQANGQLMPGSHMAVHSKPYSEIPIGNGGDQNIMYNSYWDYNGPSSPSKR